MQMSGWLVGGCGHPQELQAKAHQAETADSPEPKQDGIVQVSENKLGTPGFEHIGSKNSAGSHSEKGKWGQ